jgi:hypothetical protein
MRMTMRMTTTMKMMMMAEEMLSRHPLLLHHLLPPPEFVIEEEEDLEEMVLEQEAPEAWEVILLKEEPEPPHPDLFTMLMRDHEEIPSRMFDDLDDPTHVDYDMDEWFLKDGSHDHD